MINQFKFKDKVVVVVGGANGIGEACANYMASLGSHIIILDKDGAAAKSVSENIPNSLSFELDICDANQIDEVFEKVPNVDVLVNSAGVARRQPALDHNKSDWDLVANVNTTGSFLCAQAAARKMVKAKQPGCITNIASIMGLSGGGIYPNVSYQTSKGAIVNMTRALAVEWAPYDIRVNSVAPTYVRTEFIRPLLDDPYTVRRIEEMTPLGKIAEPGDVAAAVAFLSSSAASMITGHTLPVDGGFLAQ
ncbi:SDR family NAD(P)-dependent oxidoreductase [Roseobacter sp. HKCCD7870]|uniref:SDR family NAD(P)-dependent oxidoreductase n=1 Tax=Roseobacter sp. HKCCD7870 TaxID=3120343 RepID=UPI0030EC4392